MLYYMYSLPIEVCCLDDNHKLACSSPASDLDLKPCALGTACSMYTTRDNEDSSTASRDSSQELNEAAYALHPFQSVAQVL